MTNSNYRKEVNVSFSFFSSIAQLYADCSMLLNGVKSIRYLLKTNKVTLEEKGNSSEHIDFCINQKILTWCITAQPQPVRQDSESTEDK